MVSSGIKPFTFFDLARWIVGADPIEVFAAGSALAEPRLLELGDVDTSVCVLTMPSGAMVHIDCTRRTGYGYDERIEVMGSDGMVESMRHRTGWVAHYGGDRIASSPMPPGWFEQVQPTYALALDHLSLWGKGERWSRPCWMDSRPRPSPRRRPAASGLANANGSPMNWFPTPR